jgi:hypothetical protein
MIVQRQVEISQSDLKSDLICIATFLPVRRWMDIIAFLQMSFRVERQLKELQGVVRYGLRVDIPRKYFWTFSVWKDRASVNAFVAADPHATAVGKFQHWAGEGAAFVEWDSSDGKIDWNETLRRLQNPTFYYRTPSQFTT